MECRYLCSVMEKVNFQLSLSHNKYCFFNGSVYQSDIKNKNISLICYLEGDTSKFNLNWVFSPDFLRCKKKKKKKDQSKKEN